jgi:4-hydroxybenzoate polyprenyltransferase
MSIPELLRSTATLVRSRLEAIFVWSWATTVSCLIVGRGFPPLIPTLKSIVAMIFISLSVYIYNDINDRELDKINPFKKTRPLPAGKVPIKHAKILVVISSLIGLSVAFSINFYCFIFSLVYFILYSIYSYPKIHLKKRYIIKESVVTSGFILTSLVGSYAVVGMFAKNAFFASLINSFLSFAFQPVITDTSDIEVDRIQGVKTIAMVLSWKRKMQLLITSVLIIMTITPLTYVQFGFNMMFPIYIVAGSLMFLSYMFPMINKFEQIKTLKTRKVAFIYYTFLQFFAILGSLNMNFIF